MTRPRPAEFRSDRARGVCAALVLSGLLGGVSLARAIDPPACTAWAGEFDPLPTVADPDPLRARWARMRADQLVELAARAEARDRLEAERLWRRVRCLEPESAPALAGIERTAHSEPVSVAPPPRPVEPPAVRPLPRPKPAGPLAPPNVAAPLDHVEELIRAARFGDALGEIERMRRGAVPPKERARLEVLAATAHVAFGDEAAARASFDRALHADPQLALDERATSPKLMRVLDDARAALAAPSYRPAAADVRPLDSGAAP